MVKEYEVPQEEPQMVAEPVGTYAYATKMVHHYSAVDRGDISTAISGQELKRRLHESLKSRF